VNLIPLSSDEANNGGAIIRLPPCLQGIVLLLLTFNFLELVSNTALGACEHNEEENIYT
jgi:hypothetical protein